MCERVVVIIIISKNQKGRGELAEEDIIIAIIINIITLALKNITHPANNKIIASSLVYRVVVFTRITRVQKSIKLIIINIILI